MNLKALIENQKTQSKMRKPSGNRIPMPQDTILKLNKDKNRKSAAIKPSQIQSDSSFQKGKELFNSELYHCAEVQKKDENPKKKRLIEMDEALKVEEYTTSQSPKYHNEYNMMGNGNEDNNFDDEYHEIDQEIKIPAFLGRGSLDPKEKNQFYMTQIINQSRQNQYNSSNSYVNTKQANSLASSNLKLPRSKLKQSAEKNSQAINKSQVIRNMQNKQVSPIVKHDPKLFNLHEFGHYIPLNNESKSKKNKSNLNASALITSSKDYLNSTAPINMNQLNKIYKEEAIAQGFSDTVNSTQNLKRMSSKESQQQDHINFSSYYSGVLGPKAIRTGVSSKKSMSPIKAAKKQILIQSILSQEKTKPQPNNKYFLNLTLQQLIQQQHQENTSGLQFQTYQRQKSNTQHEDMMQKNQQKRLNKTLDCFKDQYVNSYQNYQTESQPKKRAHISNFSNQNVTLSTLQKHNVKKSTSKNKFSNTMKISDFNQTQIFDIHPNTSSQLQENGRKCKNSLKHTQNLNFHEDLPNTQLRKASALSTYSNTAQTTTTHHMNKQNKMISAKQGNPQVQNFGDQQSKLKHKRQGSQDKDLIQKILNFYQDDFLQQYNVNTDAKNKTYSSGKLHANINKAVSLTKHKPNSTLNQYLQNKSNIYNDLQPVIQSQQQQNGGVNPYNQMRQKKVNSYLKQDQMKELQNKTQPIPKSLLEIANTQAINLSTGTSIIQTKNHSRDSIGKHNKNRASKSRTAIRCQDEKAVEIEEPKQQELPLLQQEAVPQKPKVGKRKDIEIAKGVNTEKEDDPVEVYNNKNTIILDEAFPSSGEINSELDDNGKEQSKLDRFILGKQIGQGAYAVVRVATLKKDNKKYAIKIYDKSKLTDTNRQRSVRREIKLLQKMNNPNIVKIYEAFETEHHVYLVMEYVGGGSLHSYLKEKATRRLDEEEAKRIFKQIITALQYCHRKSIAHRDIKLENILLDDEKNVKLIDFGFSTCIPNEKKIKMFCGTPSYMAPEIVLKEEYAGPPADIWASAVLLYALMNGCFPFRGATDKELYRRIQRGTFVLQNQNVTDAFVDLLTKMININADNRPNAEDVLEDQWFKIDSSKAQKGDSESISDQKRLFKAKILGKIPVEKTKNTICLNSSQEQMKNHQFARVNNSNLGSGGAGIANFQNHAPNNVNNITTDFSDYGIQNQNVMKKLNQEAYQAYYNTSGGNFGMNAGANIQNPYYNNFFQNNFIGNLPNPNTMGFYPGFNNAQVRGSPVKNSNPPQMPPNFPINFNQSQPGQNIGTPQVFGSPSSFQCNSGMINNNFNIINNCESNNINRPQIICNITQVTCFSPQTTNHQDILQQPQQQNKQQPSPLGQVANPQSEQKKNLDLEIDEEIVGSITQLGYQRSHVVSQLENDSSHISHVYARLKEEKMSQTQNRPLSLQPQRKNHYTIKGTHNNPIFPNFVPSLPDSMKAFGDDNKDDKNQNYYELNDYVAMSPKQNANGSFTSF